MRGRLVFGGGTLAVILAVGSCTDDVGITVTERFTATLNGANERPTPVTTGATGTAEFTYGAEIGLTEEGRLLGHLVIGGQILSEHATVLAHQQVGRWRWREQQAADRDRQAGKSPASAP